MCARRPVKPPRMTAYLMHFSCPYGEAECRCEYPLLITCRGEYSVGTYVLHKAVLGSDTAILHLLLARRSRAIVEGRFARSGGSARHRIHSWILKTAYFRSDVDRWRGSESITYPRCMDAVLARSGVWSFDLWALVNSPDPPNDCKQ